MTTTLLQPASDVLITEVSPSRNWAGYSYLGVSGASSNRRISYLYFNQPFPAGATIVSATLRLFQANVAAGGSRTLSVRRVTSAFVESKVTWDTRPASTGTATSPALGNGGASGREWATDVTSLLQSVSDGAPWYGFSVESTNTTPLAFFSRESADWFPTLEVEFSDAPTQPSELFPSGGHAVSIARPTLRFDYTDLSGSVGLAAVQVQTNATNAWSSPTFDSGTVASSVPEFALTSDVSVGATLWWRVRVQDTAGLWSDWSDGVSFVRTAKPTVTITNPAASPNDKVFDTSPTFSWTVSGGTQRSYQLFLTDPDSPTTVIWTSTKVTGTVTSVSLPDVQPPLISPGGTYLLTLRVWDTVTRESTPNDPPYVAMSRQFTFDLSGSVSPVTGLSASAVADEPWVDLVFSRSAAPDSFTILCDGLAIASKLDPDDLSTGGTGYAYRVTSASPRTSHTYTVLAVVGTSSSASNPTATATTEPLGTWLYALDGSVAVCIRNKPDADKVISFAASEDTTVHKPVGSRNSVLVTQAMRGRDGSGDGMLTDGVADWDALVRTRGNTLGLTMMDTATRVQIYNTYRDVEAEFLGAIPVEFDLIEIT